MAATQEDKPAAAAPAAAPTAAAEPAQADSKPDAAGEKTHKLEHRWTLWFDNFSSAPQANAEKHAGWGNTLRAVYSFDTVEDFWRLYNNIKPPSFFTHKADLHLFKEGVTPKWEDPSCARGGSWTVVVSNQGGQQVAKQQLDTYWLHLVLAVIGEQFTEGEDICGVVVNLRQRQDKICLWTKTASNEAWQVNLGKELRQTLDLEPSQKIGFIAHEDQLTGNKNVKDKYMV